MSGLRVGLDAVTPTRPMRFDHRGGGQLVLCGCVVDSIAFDFALPGEVFD